MCLEIALFMTHDTVSSKKIQDRADCSTSGGDTQAGVLIVLSAVIYCDIGSRPFLFDAGLTGCRHSASARDVRRTIAVDDRRQHARPPTTSLPACATRHELFDAPVNLIRSAVDDDDERRIRLCLEIACHRSKYRPPRPASCGAVGNRLNAAAAADDDDDDDAETESALFSDSSAVGRRNICRGCCPLTERWLATIVDAITTVSTNAVVRAPAGRPPTSRQRWYCLAPSEARGSTSWHVQMISFNAISLTSAAFDPIKRCKFIRANKSNTEKHKRFTFQVLVPLVTYSVILTVWWSCSFYRYFATRSMHTRMT